MEEEHQGNDSSERPKSSHRAVLEKKLSIAERAVATNPSCVALQLERLRICQELWEPSLLTKEWKKLVSLQYLFLYATLLMFLYLSYLQSWTVKLLLRLWFIFFALKSGMVGSSTLTQPYFKGSSTKKNQFPPLEYQNASLSQENSHIPNLCHLTDIRTEIVFYLLHFRCSSTQTVPPCGKSIYCSHRATSATSLCQRSTLPTESVSARLVLCGMAAWSLTQPCQGLKRICWVTEILFSL